MFTIENKIIDGRIPYIKFSCDLEACKGGCCTLKGGKGAPLTDSEITEIENALPVVARYLGARSLREVENNHGIEGSPGSFTTGCIDNKDCVFVYYDGDIAKCAFEKAYFNNEIKWRKPISCHLFPIRVANFGGEVIRFEKISECEPAIVNGRKNNIRLYDFLREALIRRYGEQWYKLFLENCELHSKLESEIQT